METVDLFHIPDGKPIKMAAVSWQSMQGTPRARSYTVISSTPKAPKPPEVVKLEEELEADESSETNKTNKKSGRPKRN